MRGSIPSEVRTMIEEFNRGEKARVAQTVDRSQQRKEQRILDCLNNWKNKRPEDVMQLAQEMGYSIVGGGEHKHIAIIGFDRGRRSEEYVCSLPDHGGGKSLASGTLRSILDSMRNHWEQK